MGRTSKEDVARTRLRIVEKAAEQFRASGVEAVSVADVMGALGMTVGGFYRHFASKGALVGEAVALAFKQVNASWEKVAEAETDGHTDHRRRLISHYLAPKPDHQRCPMIAFGPHVSSSGAATTSQEAYRDGADALLARFMRQGGSPSESADHDALVLFAAMVGA